MDPNNKVGELLETGQNTTTNAVKTVATDVKGQLGITDKNDPQQRVLDRAKADEQVKRYYEPSEYITGMILGQSNTSQLTDEQRIQKARDELAALARQHKEVYFDPLVNPPKPPEPPKAEELEREKQQKMAELQQEKAKQTAEEQVLQRQQAAVEMRGSPG